MVYSALSNKTCREWFRRFKNDNFDVEDKEHSKQPRAFEELHALVYEDSCQTQKQLAETLNCV